MARVETRVARIADALLAERRYVRPIDVLVGLGWLAQPNVDRWERGRVPSIDRCLGVDSDKVPAALAALQRWAEDRGLTPSEADYQDLQFTPTVTLTPRRTVRCVPRRGTGHALQDESAKFRSSRARKRKVSLPMGLLVLRCL
jgi:hypothetical protein